MFANCKIKVALAGNRTRAARVAGEHSTTEPPMLTHTVTHLAAFASVNAIYALLGSDSEILPPNHDTKAIGFMPGVLHYKARAHSERYGDPSV